VLRELGIVADLWDKPQERTDVTPFSEDDTARDYDPALAAAWFALLTEVHGTFNDWRSPFFGRSGVQFWCGGFDLTEVLFSGRPSTPRAGADYVMRHDLDAEQLTIGFWPGDDAREAMFFAYLVPEPAACAVYPLPVPSAAWAPAMGEWVLPYAAVRESDNRNALLRGFMEPSSGLRAILAGGTLPVSPMSSRRVDPGWMRSQGSRHELIVRYGDHPLRGHDLASAGRLVRRPLAFLIRQVSRPGTDGRRRVARVQ
jgi:hypothetical protein